MKKIIYFNAPTHRVLEREKEVFFLSIKAFSDAMT